VRGGPGLGFNARQGQFYRENNSQHRTRRTQRGDHPEHRSETDGVHEFDGVAITN
jgi:hypothetical protein